MPYNCTVCAIGASCHKLLVTVQQALLSVPSPAAQAAKDKSLVLYNCKQSECNNVNFADCSHIWLPTLDCKHALIDHSVPATCLRFGWDTSWVHALKTQNPANFKLTIASEIGKIQ